MKKWNKAELIVLNISETANGYRHKNNENTNGQKWENTMHDPTTNPQDNCVECHPATTDDNDDIVNSES